MQLQLHYTNSTTPQLQLRYITTTTPAALHHTTSSSCGWGDRPGDHCNHCNHSKKHSSNHLSVHQWIRSAIRDSQQPISPVRFLFLKLPPLPCAVLLVHHEFSTQVLSPSILLVFRSFYIRRWTVFTSLSALDFTPLPMANVVIVAWHSRLPGKPLHMACVIHYKNNANIYLLVK